MKRFEYKKYSEEQHGEGVLTDIIKTVGKKAAEKTATTIGEYTGKKAGDKIIELLSKRKEKPKLTKTKNPKPKTLTDYEVNERLSQMLGGKIKHP